MTDEARTLQERYNKTMSKFNAETSGVAIFTKNNIALRKLTPLECFRLQGWEDQYFHRAEMVNSDSQLYKQAGNGVTVPVIKAIAERMKIYE